MRQQWQSNADKNKFPNDAAMEFHFGHRSRTLILIGMSPKSFEFLHASVTIGHHTQRFGALQINSDQRTVR
jgi:hypothetical protein